MLQCESSSDWHVFGVRVGQAVVDAAAEEPAEDVTAEAAEEENAAE